MNTVVNISGMTCGHCVASVTEELQELDGVENVAVELNKAGLSPTTITSKQPLSETEISEAVAEAGYVVVSNEA
ncbi:heavy-metal-associated domain-containing protein [Arthrobacter castelli]|uniref:heavy-metal-associated domain-containing protein n=1 Tax=Arthrobacter castelli TaxID=271431 RepID=UPI00040BCF2C|nr:heavy-metal-associated domain-containing protein [Arthrobacter castelli]